MNLSSTIAKNLRDVFFGGNWTSVNVKEITSRISYEQAVEQTPTTNTIAALLFHIGYYVRAILNALQDGELTAHDKFSFTYPPINSQEDWLALRQRTLEDADDLASRIEGFPEDRWDATFFEEKYGNYYRNLHGLIEHTHYHLGQIVILTSFVRKGPS